MTTRNSNKVSTRTLLQAASAPLALGLALAASPATAQEDVSAVPGDRIVVTGSRIVRPEVEGASPVTAVTDEAIANSGLTNVTDVLRQVPALVGSEDNFLAAGSNARDGGAGVNLLNLRNLGASRTLVLVNGRRHVAGISGEAGVDINTIPVGLIERVDVLTGGVSPIYGADGVSGVVNFIMRRDFEGIDLRAQQGMSDFGDAESTFIAATAGKNFADNRGNIALSYEFRRDERVEYADRPNGRDEAFTFVRNPDDIPDDPNVPDFVPLQNIGWADSAPGGAISIDDFLLPSFLGDGSPFDPGVFLPDSGFLAVGGDNTPVPSYYGDLQPLMEHHALNLNFSYALTPGIRFFAEGKYVDSENYTISQPSFDFFTWLPADNAYIPPAIQDAIFAGNFAFFGLPDGVAFSRDNFDLGVRDETLERSLWRTVVGLDGSLNRDLDFEVSYVYGRNDTTYTSGSARIWDRYYAALDAVDEGQFLTGTPNGNIVCRSDLSAGFIEPFNISNVFGNGDPFPFYQTFTPGDGSCQPLNLFGEGVASQAAIDFVTTDLVNTYVIDQHVLTGYISGDFGDHFELPGGPVGFALGAEYRSESSSYRPDPLSTQPLDGFPNDSVLADLALLADEDGDFNVAEAFAELNIPILADMPGFELLEVSAAIRLSDYSTTGSSTSWSFSGQWAPIDDIRFRGSYSKSVRAPNITELFAPSSGGFDFLTDPCSPSNADGGTEFREANCRALIEGLGVDYDSFDFESSIEASASIGGLVTGNGTLSEEEATTWTAGVVIAPRPVPGLTLSVDWYDIDLNNAINTATLQETAEFCVDAPTLDNAFCENITRSTTTGYVTDFLLRPENVAFFETAGADITLGYTTDAGALGSVSLSATAGYLDKLNFLPANGGIVDDDRGEAGSAKWNGYGDITWSLENWTVNYGVQYVGDQLRYGNATIAADPDIVAPEYLVIDSRFMHDLQIRYSTSDDQWQYYAGVNNFTNEQPTIGDVYTPTGWRGRYLYVGLRMMTDSLGF